jgi:hypothetical protein
MPSIPELLNGHVTLEVECLDRLYLNGYIGPLATPGGLVTFMREQLGKPIPSPVVLGQVTEKFRDAVKAMAEREQIPFNHKERKDGAGLCDPLRRRRSRGDAGECRREAAETGASEAAEEVAAHCTGARVLLNRTIRPFW